MTIGTSRAIAGTAVLLVAAGVFLYFRRADDHPIISSFDMCKAAGYQISKGEGRADSCSTPEGKVFFSTAIINQEPTSTSGGTTTATSSFESMIRINLMPGQSIKSPLTITGKAVGNWYFEASFPVELLDGNGKSMMIVPAQAQGDWMTSSFVPFSVMLSFSKPATATGTIVFKNDNPSGLPENAKEVRIPIRFVE